MDHVYLHFKWNSESGRIESLCFLYTAPLSTMRFSGMRELFFQAVSDDTYLGQASACVWPMLREDVLRYCQTWRTSATCHTRQSQSRYLRMWWCCCWFYCIVSQYAHNDLYTCTQRRFTVLTTSFQLFERCMYVETALCSLYSIPVHTRRRFNVHTTSFQLYERCIDVETTLCAYSDISSKAPIHFILFYLFWKHQLW